MSDEGGEIDFLSKKLEVGVQLGDGPHTISQPLRPLVRKLAPGFETCFVLGLHLYHWCLLDDETPQLGLNESDIYALLLPFWDNPKLHIFYVNLVKPVLRVLVERPPSWEHMMMPASEDSPEPWSREPDALLLPVMEQLALPLNCLDNEAAFGSLTGFLSFRLQQGLAIKEVQFSIFFPLLGVLG